jgi:hypothetical protein
MPTDIEIKYLADQLNHDTLVNLMDGGIVLIEDSEFVWNTKENDIRSQLESERKAYYHQIAIDFVPYHLMLDSNTI